MLFQPGPDLVPAGAPGQIRNDICVWHTPIAGAEQAGGVVAPIRNENDLCAGSGRQLPECALKPSVDDIGQVPWIGRFGAIEDPIDIEKNSPHSRCRICRETPPASNRFVRKMERNRSAKVLRKSGAETCTSCGLFSLASSLE